jgi:hypothetical protein
MKQALFGIALATAGGVFIAGNVAAQTNKLSAQDYVDILQLIQSYSRILENCTNGGNDYADMYTDDATFGVSQTWGSGVKVWFRGRDELARAGGADGKGGCRPPPPNPEYHIVADLSIVATPEGAKATSTLLTMQNKTTDRGDPIHWEGGYEDTLVKTAKGWRFKSRVHVWSEVKWTDRPQDMPVRKLSEE